jgi:hypothetical protein
MARYSRRPTCLILILHMIFISVALTCTISSAAEKKVTLDEARARLDRAKTAVDRARAQCQISDVVLNEVKDNVSLNDTKALNDWLEQYRSAISSARDTMVTSGRDPSRDPEGYKDIEILLRQHINTLVTWKRKAQDSKPIDDTLLVAVGIQKEMMDLLFPVLGEELRNKR